MTLNNEQIDEIRKNILTLVQSTNTAKFQTIVDRLQDEEGFGQLLVESNCSDTHLMIIRMLHNGQAKQALYVWQSTYHYLAEQERTLDNRLNFASLYFYIAEAFYLSSNKYYGRFYLRSYMEDFSNGNGKTGSSIQQLIAVCGLGTKGIELLDNEHQELEVVASPAEHKIITTNPNEKSREEAEEDDREKVNIDLEPQAGLYFGKELTENEQNYLANHGYKVGHFVRIGQKKQEECWVKTNNKESIAHTFLVQNIKQELQKKNAKDIKINIVKEADITFTDNKGNTVAIEVETGSNYSHNKKKFTKKFEELKERYKKIIVVLTTSDYKRQYQNNLQGITINTRQDINQTLDDLTKTHTNKRRKQGPHRPRKPLK